MNFADFLKTILRENYGIISGGEGARAREVAMMNERPPQKKRSKVKLPGDMCPSSFHLVVASPLNSTEKFVVAKGAIIFQHF